MRVKIVNTALHIALFVLVQNGQAQSFVNLNFESANITGYSPGSTAVPTANALPGWSAYSMSSLSLTQQYSTVSYDGFSAGGPLIVVVDTNTATPHNAPLVGQYGVVLYGGGGYPLYSVEISQTGFVPDGTESLLFDASVLGASLSVTLDGQTITIIHLRLFSITRCMVVIYLHSQTALQH